MAFLPSSIFAIEPDIENPGIIMKICADDPAFLSNLEGHMYDTPLDWFLFWCPETYSGYSPTTRFAVLIHAPSWNTDPGKIDKIGNTPENPISVYTSHRHVNLNGEDDFDFPCTGFSELGPDTGLFEGLILMTGHLRDYDGDGEIDSEPFTDCGSGSAFGEVESAAFLETKRQGGITITWKATDDLTVIKSANYTFRQATVAFDKDVYEIGDTVNVIMKDLDYMLFDGFFKFWEVRVKSDSDLAGINVKVWWDEEKNYPTPYFLHDQFYGSFTLTDAEDSLSDGRLRVSPGDTIYVEFDDYSLPPPYGSEDNITVSDSSKIIFSKFSRTGVDLNHAYPVNYKGNKIDEISAGNNVQIKTVIENLNPHSKPVTCIVVIKNSEIVESVFWTSVNLEPNKTKEIIQSWQPPSKGEYIATVYVWDALDSRNPYDLPKDFILRVND